MTKELIKKLEAIRLALSDAEKHAYDVDRRPQIGYQISLIKDRVRLMLPPKIGGE